MKTPIKRLFYKLNLITLPVFAAFSFLSCNSLTNGPVSSSTPPDPVAYDFTQGNIKTTGQILDLGLEGDCFFIMKQGSDFLYYRRPGSFFRDKDGYFVLGFNNIRLQGISIMDTGVSPGPALNTLADIKIPISLIEKPRATTVIQFACNLDRGPDRIGGSASVDVYDHSGSSYGMTITFKATQDSAGWEWGITMPDSVAILYGNTGYIHFDADGTPDTVGFDDGARSFIFSPINSADTVRITLDMGHHGSFLGITNFSSSTTVIAKSQDGYPQGSLLEINIDGSGAIWGVFANGVSRRLFQIPIARFPCREGLKLYEKKYFLETEYSGAPLIAIPDTYVAILRAGCIELEP